MKDIKMRLKISRALMVVVMGTGLIFAAGCSDKNAEVSPPPAQEQPAAEPEKTEPEKQEPVTEELVVFENNQKDFSISLPARFKLDETIEIAEEPAGFVYKLSDGNETLEISDIAFPGVEVNEELIHEEIEMGSGLEVLRMDNITVTDQGTFYGALVNDTSTGKYVFYHRIQKDDRIISFLQMRKTPYSLEEEAANKVMLSSIRFS